MTQNQKVAFPHIAVLPKAKDSNSDSKAPNKKETTWIRSKKLIRELRN